MTVRFALPVLVLWLAVLGRAAQQTPIPPGPDVPVSDGWYHVPSCTIAQGRQAPSMPLAEALRRKFGPCPICEPTRVNAEIGAFVAAHGAAIAEEVRRKAEEAAAEAKRKADEAEAERLRHIAEDEEARRKRESAPPVRLAEAQVREVAAQAAAEAKGDAAAFQRAFRQRMRALDPDYAGTQIVFGSGTLRITLAGPVGKFEAAATERVSRGQALTGLAWSPDATVAVVPQQPDAPDIERIVVQRSDASRPLGSEIVIAPLATTLEAKPVRFTSGATRTMHAGEVVFPLSAFDPGTGVTVRVIAVPAGAAPINRTFTSLQLRAVQ